MSDWTLELFIAGLVAYVPQKDGTRICGLMPDTRALPAQRHIPELIFEKQHVKDRPDLVSTPAKNVVEEYYGPGGTYQWLLYECRLAIEAPAGTTIDTPFELVRVNPPPTGEAPAPGEEPDFGWIPQMKDIHAAAADVNPECLGDDPARGNAMAKFTLDRGRLSVKSLGKPPVGPTPVWQFAKNDSPADHCGLKRACATQVKCVMDVSGGPLVFRSKRFGDKSELGGFAVGGPGSGTVTVYLQNLPDTFEKVRYEMIGGKEWEIDEDFLLYYRVSGDPNVAGKCVPTREKPAGEPKGRRTDCGKVLMNAVDGV